MKNPPSPLFSKARLALLTFALVVIGLLCQRVLIAGIHHLHPPNWDYFGPDLFYALLGTYEPVALFFIIFSALLFAGLHLYGRARDAAVLRLDRRHLLALSGAVFVVCFLGARFFYLDFPVTMDENAAFFQAKIFLHGHIGMPIPDRLQWLGTSLAPPLVVEQRNHTLIEAYLPVYSALLAATSLLLGSPWFCNPLLSAGCVLLLHRVARNGGLTPAASGWAVIFLVTSSQFLINGMSGYAMTAHLFFSLLWLAFYTHPDKRFYYLCPLIGALAMGLHQFVNHAVFVCPFLVRLLWDRRWREAAFSAAVYLISGLFWIWWLVQTRPETGAVAENLFGLPSQKSVFILLLSLILLCNWQNLLALVFLAAGVRKFFAMPPLLRDLTWSAALTLGFFFVLFQTSQGAGWGYRYMFPVLGNLFIVAGWAAGQFAVSRASLVAVTLIALGGQLPFRCWEVRNVVSDQYAYEQYVRHQDADIVILDGDGAWVWDAGNLSRNEPDFSNRPVTVFRNRLTAEQLARLRRDYKTITISKKDLADLGIPIVW